MPGRGQRNGPGGVRRALREDGLAPANLPDVAVDDRARSRKLGLGLATRREHGQWSYRYEREEGQGEARPIDSIHAEAGSCKALGGFSSVQ